MVQFNFQGFIAPVFTIFNDDLSINVNDIQKYAKFLLDCNIKGILVHGTTGEGPSLSVQERKTITEAWVQAVKITKQHLMIQVGGCPLSDVLELAKHAESLGVDSLLTLPELYFKPTNYNELIDYLEVISEAAPKTPLLYYHIPGFTQVNIHMGQFLENCVGKIPTFKGIKFTSTNLDEGMAAKRAGDGQFSVFLGADQLLAGAFTLGFDSAIATTLNICPKLSLDILEAIEHNQVVKAREIQRNLTKICEIITENGSWVPTMKTAMNYLTPIKVGPTRSPLKNLTNNQIVQMQSKLNKFLNA